MTTAIVGTGGLGSVIARHLSAPSMGRVGATTPPWRASLACCRRTSWTAVAWDTRGAEDRNRHLDRTDLSPSPTPGRARAVDTDRIRSHHDHTGQSGRVTKTVTYSCSRHKNFEAGL